MQFAFKKDCYFKTGSEILKLRLKIHANKPLVNLNPITIESPKSQFPQKYKETTVHSFLPYKHVLSAIVIKSNMGETEWSVLDYGPKAGNLQESLQNQLMYFDWMIQVLQWLYNTVACLQFKSCNNKS